MEWIKIEDKFPDNNREVLVAAIDGQVYLDTWIREIRRFFSFRNESVVGWMEKPVHPYNIDNSEEPPKDNHNLKP
jgi:hypothetical protein